MGEYNNETKKTQNEDASLMLEWMHDESFVKDVQANFSAKTLEDCNLFILSSKDIHKNFHLAMLNVAF